VITLVLGGARSGKSTVAERLAARSTEPVTYVATMIVGDDVDLATRVDAHKERRPAEWHTVDAGTDLPDVLGRVDGTVLLDALGPWVAAHDGPVDPAALCQALIARQGDTIVVSDEVGLGVHPSSAEGRQFRDALGTVNQAVAAVADVVLLVIAGRVLPLDLLEG
jgi:adenosyl cobinamide kinase/adenosyl cobinamide phosphate guanylyltransferase